MSRITVVIPCRNEELHISTCIEHVLNSTNLELHHLHVVVVDGGSTDQSKTIVEVITKKHSNVSLVSNIKGITPIAFNLGIEFDSSADYVQIIGARHFISTNYISTALTLLERDASIWCVGGRVVNDFQNSISKVIAYVMSTSLGMGVGNFRTLNTSCFTDTVTSPMYPMWVFKKIGMFDSRLIRNQDDDFNYRVLKNGGKIFYEHSIFLKYRVRSSIKNTFKQFYQYGYWKVFVNKKHAAITTLRQLIPPLFTIYLLLLPVFIYFMDHVLLLCGPLAAYVLLNFYYTAFSKLPIKQWHQIVLMYWNIHIAYGWGYLHGIFRFLILRKSPEISQTSLSR